MSLTQIIILILAVYCCLMLIDCWVVGKRLKSILAGTKSRKSGINPLFCYTFAGRKLLRLSENVQYKFAVLNWQAENSIQNSLSSQVIHKESKETGSFFQGILNALFTKLRADTVYIMTMVVDGKSNVEVKQSQSRNSQALPHKLTTYLVNFYHTFFKHNDQSLLGLRDGFQSKSLTGEFYLFGYRYVIALPISYTNLDGQAVRGLLWLGYDKNSEPYAHEVNIAKEVCGKIESEFASQRIIDELSTKVKEEKVINKQRDEFLAHVSHDIRSPLNNIRSIINLMRLEGTDKQELELLDTALGNCYDVEELINTILDFTRYQAGQLTNKSENFEINFLADEIISNQKIEARIKNLTLNINYDRSQRIFLNVDKKQIKRVINNLISNAIKYTRQGAIDVLISSNEQGVCSIKVIDTGIGMSAEQLKLLFTPFYRFHQKEADGIGLGLTLSKILVELNGGTLKVDSLVNQGSVFEITFPCVVKSVNSPAERIQAFIPDQAPSIEVMVLDDNAVAVESLSRMLVKLGFNVTKCFTVSDAMSIVNFTTPDFIISDWHMPDGGAKRLLEYLKQTGCESRVCVLSGSSDESTRKEISQFEVEKIFCKSDDFEELYGWLKGIQNQASSTDEPTFLNSKTG